MRRAAKGRAGSKGQATVELALLMLLIVPIFLYALFCEDLLRHKLTLQEAVTSTPWDFEGVNYEQFDRSRDVDHPDVKVTKDSIQNRTGVQLTTNTQGYAAPGTFAREMWCDHTSAYNSYDSHYDCDEDVHHKALSAHVCWIVEGGQQVGCGIDPDTAASYFDPLGTITPLEKEVHKGGEIFCSARAGVLNYFLAQKLFTSFSNVDTTRTTDLNAGDGPTQSADVHSHYNAAASSIYLLTMQAQSIVHDPWAQTTVEDVDPPGSGVLQTRTNKIYGSLPGLAPFALAGVFLAQAVQKHLLSPLALVPADTPFSDDLLSANVAFKKAPGGDVDGYFTSPWKDWNNDPVKASYDARGKYYMGATSEPN